MAVHARYKSLYVFFCRSLKNKQQREMTKLCVFWRTRLTVAAFSYLYLELNAVITYLAIGVLDSTDKIATGQEIVRETKNSSRLGKSREVLFLIREN